MSNVTSEVGDMIRVGVSMDASRGITEEQSNSSSNIVSVIKSTPTNSSEISKPHCYLSDSDIIIEVESNMTLDASATLSNVL